MNDLYKFNYECLAAHNSIRNAHNVKGLEYDKNLANSSQEYAERLAKLEVLEHSKNTERPNIGENLAFSYKPYVNYKYSGRGATVSWYSEIKDYDFKREKQKDGNPTTGHFSQVVWKDCNKAGFGRAQSANKGWYIVGRYESAGNVLGRYKENINPCSYPKWEEVPVVQEYLEELRTMECTSARKHVLDVCTSKTQLINVKGVKTYIVTETFESPIFGTYVDSETFSENPNKLPRPEYPGVENDLDSVDEKMLLAVYSHPEERIPNSQNFSVDDFRITILRCHNIYRQNHNVPALQIDESLCLLAQRWAQQLSDIGSLGLCNCEFNNSEVGENISSLVNRNIIESGKRTIDRWYDERNMYEYKGEPVNFSRIGHFTQIVWKNSKKIGIGIAENSSRINYFVCFYYPPGNIENNFAKNVQKPIRQR